MMTPAELDTETAARFISMRISQYGPLPFQLLSPTPYPGKIGIRLHPDDQYSIVNAVAFLDWLNRKNPSIEKLKSALNKKIKQTRRHV